MAEKKSTEEVKPQATKETPTITAADLNMMVNIIDAGSQRGAWRGEELSVIGNLRTKLKEVVALVAPQLAEQEKQAEEKKEAKESAPDSDQNDSE